MDQTVVRWAADLEDRGLPNESSRTASRNEVRALWQRAPDWYNITELNRRYLEGRLPSCASYDEPVAGETGTFSRILDLHDYGLLSTNSCPGFEHSHTRQRSFLYFSLPTQGANISLNAIRHFVIGLVNSREVYAHVRYQYHRAATGVTRDIRISGLMERGSYDNLPKPSDPIFNAECWTYDLDNRNQVCSFNYPQEQFRGPNGRWTFDDTGNYRITTCGSAFGDDARPLPASHTADPLQISVVARNWNYRGIGDLVGSLLDRAGISRSFAAPSYRY